MSYSAGSDRRSSLRQSVLFSCIQLNDDNGGIILNVSERGLATKLVRGLGEAQYADLRFQFSQFEAWVEARGRIAWIDSSKCIFGIEFVELAPNQSHLLKEWLSLDSDVVATGRAEEQTAVKLDEMPSKRIEVTSPAQNQSYRSNEAKLEDSFQISSRIEEQYFETPSQRTISADTGDPAHFLRLRPALFQQDSKIDRRTSNLSRVKWLLLFSVGAVVLTAALPLSPTHLLRVAEGQQHALKVSGITATPDASEHSAPDATPAAIPHENRQPNTADYILQVAAMSREQNANTLVESLRNRDFPAFVIKTDRDSLYRVAVGPYDNAEATQRAHEKLTKQGLKAIVKRRSAQSGGILQ